MHKACPLTMTSMSPKQPMLLHGAIVLKFHYGARVRVWLSSKIGNWWHEQTPIRMAKNETMKNSFGWFWLRCWFGWGYRHHHLLTICINHISEDGSVFRIIWLWLWFCCIRFGLTANLVKLIKSMRWLPSRARTLCCFESSLYRISRFLSVVIWI